MTGGAVPDEPSFSDLPSDDPPAPGEPVPANPDVEPEGDPTRD